MLTRPSLWASWANAEAVISLLLHRASASAKLCTIWQGLLVAHAQANCTGACSVCLETPFWNYLMINFKPHTISFSFLPSFSYSLYISLFVFLSTDSAFLMTTLHVRFFQFTFQLPVLILMLCSWPRGPFLYVLRCLFWTFGILSFFSFPLMESAWVMPRLCLYATFPFS